MLPTVAIVGRPNVGKSTFFNRLVGERLSITDDQPGVTRDRIYAKCEWLGRQFNLIDTGGIEIKDAPFLVEIRAQAEIAIEEADVVIMLADGRGSITDADEMVARLLQRSGKPIILALNKMDNESYQDNLYEYYALGIGDPFAVSTVHGIGVGDVLDEVVQLLPAKQEEVDDDIIRFSIIGRPNVGKSSLTNAILDQERVIVSDIEGTTRDSIDSRFTREKKEYIVIDTAGIRKSGKIQENAEKYSVLRAMRAIDRSDICVILIDADTGIREQDKHIAGYAKDANKAVIIVVNKWDLIDKTSNVMKEWERNIRAHFKFITYAPVIFLSALTKKRIHTLFEAIDRIYENFHKRFKTYVINDLMQDAQAMNPTPNFHGGRLNIKYVTQASVGPPTFILFVNEPEYAHFSYLRYLENVLRDSFDFEGTPIHFLLRKSE